MSTIIQSKVQRRYRPVEGTDGPEPGWFETIGAGFRLQEDRDEREQFERQIGAYRDLLDTLGDLGVDVGPNSKFHHRLPASLVQMSGHETIYDIDEIYAEVLRQNARNPKAFSGLPASREEFDQWTANRRGQRARDQRTAERGGLTGTIIGGIGSTLTQPETVPFMLFGVGQASLARTILAEAVIGALTELPNLPSAAQASARMGEPYGAAEMVEDVGLSALTSGVFGGAVRGVEISAPKVGASIGGRVDAKRARLEQVITDNWERLPEAVRTRWAKGAAIPDTDLPDIAETLIGRGNMSIDERGAVDAMRREAQILSISPFKPGMAGDAAHVERMDHALSTLLRPDARPRPQPTVPTRRALNSGTALSSGATPRAELKARIGGAESGGAANPNTAKNPLSSARGKYQFIDGTWLRYYKRRFGGQGMTNAEILAKRSDPRIQDVLMDDLIDDNSAFLRGIGEAQSAGNLYLVHFAGPGGARKLFAADPGARAADVLGADVARANPWMRDMSAGDVIAWAHRKMNEPAPRRAGARSELAGEGRAEIDRLQMEIDRLDAEADAARAARAAEDPFGGLFEPDPAPVLPSVEQAWVPTADVEAAADVPGVAAPVRDPAAAGLPDRTAALVPAMRAEIAATGMADVEAMARRLDASEAEVREITARILSEEPTPGAAAVDATEGESAAPDGVRSMSDDVRAALKAEGWKVDGDRATKSFDGMAGTAKGERQIVLRIGGGGRWLERVDGVDVNRAADLRAFAGDAPSAIRAALGGLPRDGGDLFTAPSPHAAAAAPPPIDVAEVVARGGWDDEADRAAVELADSVIHDMDALHGETGEPLSFFLDEEGGARSWADIAQEIADDEAALVAMKACL